MNEFLAQNCEREAEKWHRKGMHGLAQQYEEIAQQHRERDSEPIGQLIVGEAVRPSEESRALEGRWLAFHASANEEGARQRFERRYGAPPARVLRRLGLLLLGPVPERMSDSLADPDRMM